MFEPRTNARIGEYEVLEQLGQGGQAKVYRAKHHLMDREVAIKILSDEYAQDPEMLRRFGIEIRVSAMLSHQHILRAYHASEFRGIPYLVMELCQGNDMGRVLNTANRLSPADAVSYVRQAALGLSFAHDHAVVHRDVKPSNLFLTDDKTLLVFDWGLARLHSASPVEVTEVTQEMPSPLVWPLADTNVPANEKIYDTLQPIWSHAGDLAQQTFIRPVAGARQSQTATALSWAGNVVGTPCFMSPEQARSSDVDLRTDIYSLGATLFSFLAGRPMFEGDVLDVLRLHGTGEVPSISALRGDVSEELEAAQRRMVEKKPEDRYQSMGEVIEALDRLGIHSKIFISYRREDSLDATDRMYERLREHFGVENVFMDVDTIPPGTDFRQHLHQAVAQAGVVLAVIGDHWLAASSKGMWRRRRLDDPNDFVRIEIEAALKRKIPVVPVLVGQAKVPTTTELPPSMRELAYQQAAEVRPGRQYHDQIAALISTIKQHFSSTPKS